MLIFLIPACLNGVRNIDVGYQSADAAVATPFSGQYDATALWGWWSAFGVLLLGTTGSLAMLVVIVFGLVIIEIGTSWSAP